MGRLHLTGAFLSGVLCCVATHILPGKRALVSYLLPDSGGLDRWIGAKPPSRMEQWSPHWKRRPPGTSYTTRVDSNVCRQMARGVDRQRKTPEGGSHSPRRGPMLRIHREWGIDREAVGLQSAELLVPQMARPEANSNPSSWLAGGSVIAGWPRPA